MYKKICVLFFIILLLVSLLNCELLRSRIDYMLGTAQVLYGGEGTWVPLNVGDVIKEGDVITTDKNSVVDIKLDDKTFSRIAESSVIEIKKAETAEYEINRFPFKTKKPMKKIKLDLKLGKLLSKVGELKIQDKFEVMTPVAVVGVRGTTFEASHGNKTTIKVLSGIVSVMNPAVSKIPTIVMPGQVTSVTTGQIPESPQAMTKSEQASVVGLMEGTSTGAEPEAGPESQPSPESKESKTEAGQEPGTESTETKSEAQQTEQTTETKTEPKAVPEPVQSTPAPSTSAANLTENITKNITNPTTLTNITEEIQKAKLRLQINIK